MRQSNITPQNSQYSYTYDNPRLEIKDQEGLDYLTEMIGTCDDCDEYFLEPKQFMFIKSMKKKMAIGQTISQKQLNYLEYLNSMSEAHIAERLGDKSVPEQWKDFYNE